MAAPTRRQAPPRPLASRTARAEGSSVPPDRIRIKRIYEPPSQEDGQRILVDRLWPRGVGRQRAKLDQWLREIAPSEGLRHWFHHEAPRWEMFVDRYRSELAANPEAVARLAQIIDRGPTTLLYGAKDEERNQALVLAQFMRERFAER
ncbi:MAG: DUF488 domain-containing protein [Caulobacteraceae bacterium]